MQLLESSPKYRFFSQVPVDYEPNAYPDQQLKALLLNLTDGNRTMLELVRDMIRRAIEPAKNIQTGFWIYGPPGTGKSTFVNWLKGITGSMAVEMVIKNMTLFTNARLKGKSLLIISDGDNVNYEAINLLKKILGRDSISYDWKHEMLVSSTFVSHGVVVVTSNQNVANAMVGVYDEGFIDRMIEIPFTFVPHRPQPGLKEYLDANTSALVNWAFSGSKECLQSQVRAGQWAYSVYRNNPFIDFLCTYIVEDREGFISNAELLDLFDEFLKDNGHGPLSAGSRRKAPQTLLNLLVRTFRLFVRKGRQAGKGARGIAGIRHRNMEKDQSIPVLTLKQGPLHLTVEDPFKRHPITPYTELTENFQVSEGTGENGEIVDVVLTQKGSETSNPPQEKGNGAEPISASQAEGEEELSAPVGEKETLALGEIQKPGNVIGTTGAIEPTTGDIEPLYQIHQLRDQFPIQEQKLELIFQQSCSRWWAYDFKLPPTFSRFVPWHPFDQSERVALAFKHMLVMPQLWRELKTHIESLQPPETREHIYRKLQSQNTRERSWYTCKRIPGILSFIFPVSYIRPEDGYPRVQPRGEGSSKMGLLSAEKNFRKAVLGDLDRKLEGHGLGIYEVDLESCHTQILHTLNVGTEQLTKLMEHGENLWKTMILSLPYFIREEFGFDFLKKCAKRLCYKALQGGRIDSVGKIHKTLAPEETQSGKNLHWVAEAFHKNQLLMEFDLLNQQIMKRFRQRDQLRVYSPLNPYPFTLIPGASTQHNRDWYTKNPCRVASQIVTGV